MKRCIFTIPLAAMAGIALLSQMSMSAADENPAPPAPAASSVQLLPNAAEVLKLVRAKIGDETIVAFVQNSKTAYNLSANEIVYLREQGVSDRVITAMVAQHPQPATTWTAPATAQPPQQVVISSPPASQPPAAPVQPAPAYVAPPVYAYPPPVYYDPYPDWGVYWGPALSFSFGFGHGHWGGYHGGYHGGFHGHH